MNVDNAEVGKEYARVLAEVLALMKELAEGREYKETKRVEDANGLFQLDIEVPLPDGGVCEYSYTRKGSSPNSRNVAAETAIHMTIYDADSMPCGGNSVMKLSDDGVWVKTP